MLMKHMDAKHKIDVEKRKATHSGILAWEIPWMEEPEKLQPMESQKSWRWLSK